MQTKLISQTGLKVRTNCRLGYFTFHNKSLSQAQWGNNYCIFQRDERSVECKQDWPKKAWYCEGNNNGKELDRCMATVWNPEELKTYRSQGGTPYASTDGGDKCFDEFYDRYKQKWAIGDNKAEWEKCLATFS